MCVSYKGVRARVRVQSSSSECTPCTAAAADEYVLELLPNYTRHTVVFGLNIQVFSSKTYFCSSTTKYQGTSKYSEYVLILRACAAAAVY